MTKATEKHTPGPWAAIPMVPGAKNGFYIEGNRNEHNYVLDVATVNPSLNQHTAANARLIAAAPELLQFALDCEESFTADDSYSMLRIAARTLIAKATGAA